MNHHLYILDGKTPVPCDDVHKWGEEHRQMDKKRVGYTDVDGRTVSTVFLGYDHGYGDGPPLLFETMIFPEGDVFGRCSTWEDAEEMHLRGVARAKREGER